VLVNDGATPLTGLDNLDGDVASRSCNHIEARAQLKHFEIVLGL
jgi:hypothetical protein